MADGQQVASDFGSQFEQFRSAQKPPSFGDEFEQFRAQQPAPPPAPPSADEILRQQLSSRGLNVPASVPITAPPAGAGITPTKVPLVGSPEELEREQSGLAKTEPGVMAWQKNPPKPSIPAAVSSMLQPQPNDAGPLSGGVPLAWGIPQLAGGIHDIIAAKGRQDLYQGGAKIIGGTMDELMPAFTAGLIAKPVSVGGGLIAGMLTSKGAELATKAAGGSKEAQEFASAAGFFIPSIVGLNIKGFESPEVTAASGEAFGGKVAAGVARTPEGTTVAGRVGPFTKSRTFGGKPPAPTGIEPQTIQGEPGAVGPSEPEYWQPAAGPRRALPPAAGKPGPQTTPEPPETVPEVSAPHEVIARTEDGKPVIRFKEGAEKAPQKPAVPPAVQPNQTPAETPQAPTAQPQQAGQAIPEQVRAEAVNQQPELVKAAESISDQVPGTKVADPGAKSLNAIERKQDTGRPVTDAARAQIVVPDESTKQEVVEKIGQQLPTTEIQPIEAENLPIVAAKLPGSQEIQIATQREHEAQKATTDDYKAVQEAKARGDEAEANRLQKVLDAKQSAEMGVAPQGAKPEELRGGVQGPLPEFKGGTISNVGGKTDKWLKANTPNFDDIEENETAGSYEGMKVYPLKDGRNVVVRSDFRDDASPKQWVEEVPKGAEIVPRPPLGAMNSGGVYGNPLREKAALDRAKAQKASDAAAIARHDAAPESGTTVPQVGSESTTVDHKPDTVKVTQPAAEATKQPWEMTREESSAIRPMGEVEADLRRINPKLQRSFENQLTKVWDVGKHHDAAHRAIVQEALQQGHPVPANVLADYPDLQAKAPQLAASDKVSGLGGRAAPPTEAAEAETPRTPSWQMTAAESAARSDDTLDKYIQAGHRDEVAQALKRGDTVPPHVLAEYPGIDKSPSARISPEAKQAIDDAARGHFTMSWEKARPLTSVSRETTTKLLGDPQAAYEYATERAAAITDKQEQRNLAKITAAINKSATAIGEPIKPPAPPSSVTPKVEVAPVQVNAAVPTQVNAVPAPGSPAYDALAKRVAELEGKKAAVPFAEANAQLVADAQKQDYQVKFIDKKPTGYAGKHFPGSKTIEIYTKNRTPQQIQDTLTHEVGHIVDYARRGIVADPMGDSVRGYDGELRPAQDSDIYFRDSRQKEADAIRAEVPKTHSAATTQKEIYADAYKLLRQNPGRLKEIAPRIYAEVSDFVNKPAASSAAPQAKPETPVAPKGEHAAAPEKQPSKNPARDLKRGDVVIFSQKPPGSYLSTGEPYTVESVSKTGVRFRNVKTGGGTGDPFSMLALSKFEKQGTVAVTEPAKKVTAQKVESTLSQPQTFKGGDHVLLADNSHATVKAANPNMDRVTLANGQTIKASEATPITLPKVKKSNNPSELEHKLATRVEENGAKLVARYLETNTKDGVTYVGTDQAKQLFEEYRDNPTTANEAANQPAAAIAQAAWETALARPVEAGKEAVRILTGAPANGKTTAIMGGPPAPSVGINKESIILNTSYGKKIVDQAIASGRTPEIDLVYSTDYAAQVRRMVERAKKSGRPVSIDYMAKAVVGVPRVIAALKDEYGDKLRVNSTDTTSADPVDHKGTVQPAVDALKGQTEESIKGAMNEELERLREQNQVPDAIYQAASAPGIARGEARPSPSEHGAKPESGEAPHGVQLAQSAAPKEEQAVAPERVRHANLEHKVAEANSGETLYSNPFADPEAYKRFIIKPLQGMAAPLRAAIEKNAEMGHVAEGIQKELYFLNRAENARAIRMNQQIEDLLTKQGFAAADGKEVYRNIEDPKVKLTPKQEELRDQWINPLMNVAKKNYILAKLIQSGRFDLQDILDNKVSDEDIARYAPLAEGYMHRIAVNKNSMLDWALGSKAQNWVSRRNILSRQFSANKKAVFQEAHGPNGEREAVAIKNNRVTQFTTDEDGNIKMEDLGAYRSGFVTTQEMAEDAVKPIDKELSRLDAEYKTLTGTAGRKFASPQRIMGIEARIAQLNREKAGVLASVSPEYQAQLGMTDNEVLAARKEPIENRIAQLQKQREGLAGTKNPTAAQTKRLNNIDARLAEAQDRLSAVEDEFNSRANEGRYWQDKNGNLWQFKRGTTEFISGRTGQKYHDNAILSATVNYLETSRAANAAIAVERQKAMLEEAGLSMKTDNAKDVPDGWKTTRLQQMRGIYFPSYIADAYDQFTDQIERGTPNALERLNRLNLGLVLMNPWMHGKNISANWITGKLAEGLSAPSRAIDPARWVSNAKAGVRAVNAVLQTNEDYLQAMEHGLDLLGATPRFDAEQKAAIESLAEHFDKHPDDASVWQKALGIPGKVGDFIRSKNHEITFGINDAFVLQAYFSALDRFKAIGMEDPEAAARDWAHNQVVEYRPPIRAFGSRGVEKALENPSLSAFWRYHSNLLRQIGQAAKDAAGTGFETEETTDDGQGARNQYGETKNEARARGMAKLAVMIAFASAIYPLVLDPAAKWLTRNRKAQAPRGGLLGTASDIQRVIDGQKTAFQVAHSIFTPALATENLAQILANRDFYSGRHIVTPHHDIATQSGQMGNWIAGRTLPGEMQQTEKRSPGTMVWRTAGFTFPKKQPQTKGSATWQKFYKNLKGKK